MSDIFYDCLLTNGYVFELLDLLFVAKRLGERLLLEVRVKSLLPLCEFDEDILLLTLLGRLCGDAVFLDKGSPMLHTFRPQTFLFVKLTLFDQAVFLLFLNVSDASVCVVIVVQH